VSKPISITALSSISSLGTSLTQAWDSYQTQSHHLVKREFNGSMEWVGPLSKTARQEIEALKKSDRKYKMLDDTVLFALFASRNAVANAGWSSTDDFGINIGSSRGATALFEKYHEEFLLKSIASTLSSPTTTLGNISSWVAHDLGTKGPEISHSITCSTGLHSVLNGVAWLKSGMASKFLVGGSEAPLTDFTIAQMKALKIYSEYQESPSNHESDLGFPCCALNLKKKKNSMVLGEGASIACLELGVKVNALALIKGVGYATEPLLHNTSISTDAQCFQKSMKMALGPDMNTSEIDAIVMHAPGTIKGDTSEFLAIQNIFGNKIPFLTTNKWMLGHTFAASGMLNLELAVLMLMHNTQISVPYINEIFTERDIKRVIVNAVGFGGNAVSILVERK